VTPVLETVTPVLETVTPVLETVTPVVEAIAPVAETVGAAVEAPMQVGESATAIIEASPTADAPVVPDQPVAAGTSAPLEPAAPAAHLLLPSPATLPHSGAGPVLAEAMGTVPAAPDGGSGTRAAETALGTELSAPGASLFAAPSLSAPASMPAAVSSAPSAVPATEAPSSPWQPDSGLPGTGLAGSFAPPTTAVFFAVLLAFCFAPCLRYGKVVLASARWRPVLFVSLLERPG
jgi:hypothetical protein